MSDPTRADVKETYDEIAAHFSKTREYAWPEVETYIDGQTPAGVGLDVGCGNGRHTELLAAGCDRTVGVDVSRGLLAEATDRRGVGWFDLLQGDATALPLRDGAVDVAVYIATLHHLPGRDARIASLDELARVLSAEGQALVSAWSTEHDQFDADEGFDTMVDWTLPGGETVERFYHIYDPEEFLADVAASALDLVEFEVSSGNCFGVVSPAT